MTTTNDDKLIEMLTLHEGDERYAYQDSMGFITIGIGRCLDRRKGKGISPNESLYLLKNDIADCKHELENYVFYQIQDDVRKCVLIELCFNLGLMGLLDFKEMLDYMKKKDYKNATGELLKSKWSKQVSLKRAENLAYRMRYGAYPS